MARVGGGGRSHLPFAMRRLMSWIRPEVEVTPAPEMTIDWDVAVPVRDGTVLKVNVFRPSEGGPVPAIMSAHPYGKDHIPRKTRTGRGVSTQYRLFPQPERVRFSDLTSWKAPDPGFWVPHGYAVVNADLRGAGTSDGVGDLFTDAEADEYHDLIEWVGTQPWCSGQVGLNGVSYLAISEYEAATTHPPHLAAVCPWEGFSDLYRDFTHPGGVREKGFSVVWGTTTARGPRVEGDLGAELKARSNLDEWYRARTPVLERIEVPLLQCASFSDQCLHTRGSFEGPFAGPARSEMADDPSQQQVELVQQRPGPRGAAGVLRPRAEGPRQRLGPAGAGSGADLRRRP
jgi:predicted acyl esterase